VIKIHALNYQILAFLAMPNNSFINCSVSEPVVLNMMLPELYEEV